MITFKFAGCALSSTAANGVNNFTTLPLNPDEPQVGHTGQIPTINFTGFITAPRISAGAGSVIIKTDKPISFNIAEGHTITFINNDEEIPLTAGSYSFEQINEIIDLTPFKSLLPLLEKIYFETKKVNVNNLDKILKNKEKLAKLIQEGRIEASDEQISKLASLENDTYDNLHKLFLVWNNAQGINIDNNNNNNSTDINLTMLPQELLSMIFSFIPLTGTESIQAQVIRPIETETASIGQVESSTLENANTLGIEGLTINPNFNILGDINPGFDFNHNA